MTQRYRPLGLLLATAVAGLSGSCATIADTGGGDVALPNAAAGPFRELSLLELGNSRAAPYVLKDDDDYPRDLSAIDLDGDPSTLEVHAYVARTVFPEDAEPDPAAASNEIVRYVAHDGRSFERLSDTVLEPELGWEGGELRAPCAVVARGELWLYYAAAGGIGLAKSADGIAFARLPQPLLETRPGSWEQRPPTSPSVVELPDGSFRMFYEAPLSPSESAIGEAASADGENWERLGTGPVLAARTPAGEPGDVYDAVSVEAPHAVLYPSAEGRTILWLYYSAVDDTHRRTIAVAARDGVDGPWFRGTAPVFGTSGGLGPTEPWVMRYPTFTLLFATQRAGTTEAQDYPAVAAGVAPANAQLPPRVSD